MKKVVILQHRLLHYRTGLFELLRNKCILQGIDLHLVHGQATRRELIRNDTGVLSWASVVKNHYIEVKERDWVWQPFPSTLRDAELVVMMQENRLLSNYPLLLNRLWSKQKLAYWGHGVNFQSDYPNGLKEKWKRLLLNKVDWWFAYTQTTVEILKNSGYPSNQITCLNNAIDTNAFREELASISVDDLGTARDALDITKNAPIGIFCGSLYPDKQLDFLVAAIDKIYAQSPDFHCIVLGDGPSMPYMQDAATTRPWLHLLGVTKGAKKALYFRLADFMLNPGLVGLHIVDAFCASLVMVTTSGAKHSPEIAYLKNGINGIMTGNSVEEYAQNVLALIQDPRKLNMIKTAAFEDANVYTLDNMIDNFVDGICKSLSI